MTFYRLATAPRPVGVVQADLAPMPTHQHGNPVNSALSEYMTVTSELGAFDLHHCLPSDRQIAR
jgi:hypothetical protein